jgi:type I restriction enzyme S subunit
LSGTLTPLKRLAHLNPENLADDTDPDKSFRYVDIGTTGRGVLVEDPQPMRFESSPSRARRVLRPGDTILSTVRTYLRAVWTLRSEDNDLVATTGFVCLRPRSGVDSRFLGWLAQADVVVEEVVARSVGVSYPAVNPSDVGLIKVLCPDLPKQQAIADYLDRETARIDALISAKHRMVDLLEERLDAYLSICIAGDARKKDSGVAWLGPIPESWDVQPVWQLFRLGRGRVMSHEDIAANPGAYPVYSSQTADDGVMGTIGTFDFAGDYLTWTTDGANAGTVFARTGRFSCTNVCGTLKPLKPLDLVFFQFVLNRATGWYVRHDINPKLMNDVMAGIRVPVPPLEEQRRIAALLGGIREHWQSVTETMRTSVALLQERRRAMITAAVTGQLDIPEAA